MKKVTLVFSIAILSVLLWSCGESTNKETETTKTEKKEITKENPDQKITWKEMTVELYCKINNEERALLMDKYWEKFKGKDYSEVKDIYNEYDNENKALITKYNLKNRGVLNKFFKYNYSEIEEYKKTDPNNIEYPEYVEAKKKVLDLSMVNVYETN